MFSNLVYNTNCGIGLAAERSTPDRASHEYLFRNKLQEFIMPKDISQKELKDKLTYDPQTGEFKWKKWWRGRKQSLIAGCFNKGTGYQLIMINQSQYLRSRLAWLYIYGYMPKNIEVDHKNKIRTDDRIENLRLISHQCNIRNCSLSKNNTSGICGVSYAKESGKWVASIQFNGKGKRLGAFISKLEASKARFKAEVKYGYTDCQTESSAKKYIANHKDNV